MMQFDEVSLPNILIVVSDCSESDDVLSVVLTSDET